MTNSQLVTAPFRMASASPRLAAASSPRLPAAAQVMVEFRVLGPVEAVVGGRLVDLGAPKQRTLLTLLVSRVGQPVPVDVMLEELWAGRPPRSATTSLQAYVANLRKVLEPDRPPRAPATVLRTGGQGYLLDGRVVDVDVHRFVTCATAGWQAWARGDPQRALTEFEAGLALWRGQAYSEVPNATHVVPEVARLEELRLSVIEVRCAALLAVGATEMAVAELEAFMQAHPLREYGCELLSLALYRSGRQADALAVLRTNQKRLAEELGIDPRPELQNLEREILNQAPALGRSPALGVPDPIPNTRLAPSHTHAAIPAPGPAPDHEVFVGREAALRQLAEASAEAARRGRIVTVSGEPGVGKTSLLRRFAESAGVPVLWGTCSEHLATPPLWPWQQVLRTVSACCPQQSVPRPIAELLDGGARQPTDGANADGVTLRRFEAVVRYLTGASRTTPLVIVLDNLHRADPASLCLLAYLAESVSDSRLLVAVSYRRGEVAALVNTSAALARAETTRVELGGLSVLDTQALAGAMLGREIDRSTAEQLRARTDGNAFFLREFIKQLSMKQQDPARSAPIPVPTPVREVVLRRVTQLPHTAAELLLVASVAGRHFALDAVAEAAAVEIDEALEAVDAIVAAGLIVEDRQRLGWFRFTHPVTAEVLYETIGRLRQAHLQQRITTARTPPPTNARPRKNSRPTHLETILDDAPNPPEPPPMPPTPRIPGSPRIPRHDDRDPARRTTNSRRRAQPLPVVPLRRRRHSRWVWRP